MSVVHDVIVVGAGPAGLAASIVAHQAGLRVLVLEHREGPIDKACGEGLLPGALRRLGALGVELPPGHPIEGIRFRDAHHAELTAEGRFRGAARGLRRLALSSAMLARADELGVPLVRRVARDLTEGSSFVEIDGVRSRYVVAADGLRSPIRRRLGLTRAATSPARYGCRRRYRVRPWSASVEVHLGRDAEAYVTPLAGDEVGVALLRRGPGGFAETLSRFPLLEARLRGATPISDARGAGPFEQRVARRVAGRVLLVGDAAGYLDPLTGEGVALALATARAAVECIVDERPATYEERYREATARYYRVTSALLAVARRQRLHRPFLELSRRLPWLFDAALSYLDGG